MPVIGGVTCQELRESYSERIDDRGPQGTKAYLCDWSDRYAVANTMLGLTTITGGVGGVITHAQPMPFPESPNMLCREIQIRGVGEHYQGPSQIAFTKAIISTFYAVPQYNPNGLNSFDPSSPLTYATQTLDWGASVIDLKSGTLTLAGGGRLNQNFGLFIPVVQMGLRLHRLPYLPPSADRVQVGNVNSDAIWGCPPGTLRFDGMKSQIASNTDGSYLQEVDYAFAYRPVAPWDEILHPNGTTGWTQVRYNGVSILDYVDFYDLIPSAYRI